MSHTPKHHCHPGGAALRERLLKGGRSCSMLNVVSQNMISARCYTLLRGLFTKGLIALVATRRLDSRLGDGV